MGGGYSDGTLTLEIPRKRDVYPTVLHELFHAFVETKKDKIEIAVRSVPGLDIMTLNEGLAYAISPGLHHTGDSDQLQAKVSAYMAKGSPLRNRARIIAHCLYELVHWFVVPEIESAHPVDTEVQS